MSESSGSVPVCVQALGDLQREVELTITASPLSALPDQDYTFLDDVATFSPGVSQQCFNFTVSEEGLVEGDELVMVSLGQSSVADIAMPSVMVLIQDSSNVSFTFEMESYNISESETVNICVVLQGMSAREITILISLDGTGEYLHGC